MQRRITKHCFMCLCFISFKLEKMFSIMAGMCACKGTWANEIVYSLISWKGGREESRESHGSTIFLISCMYFAGFGPSTPTKKQSHSLFPSFFSPFSYTLRKLNHHHNLQFNVDLGLRHSQYTKNKIHNLSYLWPVHPLHHDLRFVGPLGQQPVRQLDNRWGWS